MDRTTPPRALGSTGGSTGRVTRTTSHSATNAATKDSPVAGSSGLSNGLSAANRSHGYCLKWKYHPNNLLHMFNQLLLNESFTDVVVACEGRVIKCHKMVLSACSKYFEQVFCEYPLQNSTLVILKDYNYSDVQAIIEFMYQGEINVSQDRLESLLKAAQSLQVKGLADITGDGGSTAVNPSGEKEEGDFTQSVNSVYSNPSSPVGCNVEPKVEIKSSISEPPVKKKRGRPPMTPHLDSTSNDALMNLSTNQQAMGEEHQFDDFPLTSMIETHYTSPPKKTRRSKSVSAPVDASELNLLVSQEEEGSEEGEDDEVTEDDIQRIVKMMDYIENGGSRQQFWEEPLTKKVMNAIKIKKMEMKSAAEFLGVSYSTLYSRYRELYGYLKMPAHQDTNMNYYQVLNLLRAGQVSLEDAAKRLNINERTLTAYLSTTITPKRPKAFKQPHSSQDSSESKLIDMGGSLAERLNPTDMSKQTGELEDANVDVDEFDDEDSDNENGRNLLLPSAKSGIDEGMWRTGR